MASAVVGRGRRQEGLRIPLRWPGLAQHAAAVALALAGGLAAARFGWVVGALVVAVALVAVTTRFWLETLAVAAMVSTFNVTRVSGLGADLSLPDLMIFLATPPAVLAIRFANPSLRRLLWVVATYQLLLAVPVLVAADRASAIEWVHRGEIVGGAVLCGALIGQRGRALLTLRVMCLPAMVVAVVAIGQHLTNGFAPATPLGLAKNGAGSLLMLMGIVLFSVRLVPSEPAMWALRALAFGGIFACQSRGALLGLVVGIVVHGVATRQRIFRSPLLLTFLLATCAYVYVNVQSAELEVADSSARRFSSVGSRERWREQALDVFAAEPLFGGGLKLFEDPRSGLEAEPHNVVALTLAEGGLFGAAAFAALAIGSVAALRRTRTWAAPMALALVLARFSHGLVDIYWAGGVTSFAWFVAGIAVGQEASDASDVPPSPRERRRRPAAFDQVRAARTLLRSPGAGDVLDAPDVRALGRTARAAALVRAPAPAPGLGRPAPMDRAPAVLVVAYGAPELLAEALAGVPELEVIVVDNSDDPRVRAVAAAHGARYEVPGRNLGFAAGVNHGLGLIGGERDVLLLNPDARITTEDVQRLGEHLHAPGRRVAAVAPRQRNAEGALDRVTWPFPSPGEAWAGAIGLSRLRPSRRRGFVIGSILLLNHRALKDVGAFDTRFFLYSEETDWQRRATNRGWSVQEVTSVVGFHVGGASSTDETVRELRFHASIERYIRKWHGSGGWAVFRLGVIVGAGVRSFVLGGDDAARRRHQARIYVTGPIRAARRRGLR